MSWSTAGGSFVSTASASNTITNTGTISFTGSLVQDVALWCNGSASNFGWIIQGSMTQGSGIKFDSVQLSIPPTPPDQTRVSFPVVVAANTSNSVLISAIAGSLSINTGNVQVLSRTPHAAGRRRSSTSDDVATVQLQGTTSTTAAALLARLVQNGVNGDANLQNAGVESVNGTAILPAPQDTSTSFAVKASTTSTAADIRSAIAASLRIALANVVVLSNTTVVNGVDTYTVELQGTTSETATQLLARLQANAVSGDQNLVNAGITQVAASSVAQASSACRAITFNGGALQFDRCCSRPTKDGGIGYMLYWTVTSATTVDIAFTGTWSPSGWVGFGIAADISSYMMVGSHAILGSQNFGSSGFGTFYLSGKSASQVLATSNFEATSYMATVNTSSIRTQFVSGVTTVIATIEFANSAALDKDVGIVWGAGPMGGTSPAKHDTGNTAGSSINFKQGTCGSVDDYILKLKRAHGWMMGLAWTFFLPLGVTIARFMKEVKPPLWFQLHRGLQILGSLMTVAGFGLGLKVGTGYFETHRRIGITVFTLVLFQVILAFFRPHPGL